MRVSQCELVLKDWIQFVRAKKLKHFFWFFFLVVISCHLISLELVYLFFLWVPCRDEQNLIGNSRTKRETWIFFSFNLSSMCSWSVLIDDIKCCIFQMNESKHNFIVFVKGNVCIRVTMRSKIQWIFNNQSTSAAFRFISCPFALLVLRFCFAFLCVYFFIITWIGVTQWNRVSHCNEQREQVGFF